MTNIKALKSFVSDDQILECLILFETRQMDAGKLLSSYMAPKWSNISTLDAVKILSSVQKEFNRKP